MHLDLMGPSAALRSIQGSLYIATFVNDNRTPQRSIQWRTPHHELWTDGHVPDVSYFRVFGSKAYVHTPEDK